MSEGVVVVSEDYLHLGRNPGRDVSTVCIVALQTTTTNKAGFTSGGGEDLQRRQISIL